MIVVGAGFAGLTAARKVKQRGKKVIVLEARNRVGGRVKAGMLAGLPVDVGGMWVGPTQTRILETIHGVGLQLLPQYLTGKNILEATGKRSAADGEKLGFEPATQTEYDRVVRELTKLSDQVPLDAPWTMSRSEEFDQMTAQDWFEAHTKDKTVLAFLQAYTRAIFTVDAYQISFLYFLFYMRSGDNFEILGGYENAAQAWTVRERCIRWLSASRRNYETASFSKRRLEQFRKKRIASW